MEKVCTAHPTRRLLHFLRDGLEDILFPPLQEAAQAAQAEGVEDGEEHQFRRREQEGLQGGRTQPLSPESTYARMGGRRMGDATTTNNRKNSSPRKTRAVVTLVGLSEPAATRMGMRMDTKLP